MTVSLWRFAHLSIAVIASLFLILASATGVILAYDAAQENLQPYKVENFKSLNLATSIPKIKEIYPEITEINIDDNGFVLLEGSDADGNSVKGYIDPNTGKFLGKPLVKSSFIEWNIQLHRSLFLKETGRYLVGIVSILLFLMGFSGLILILKRQQGAQHFFDKIKKDSLPQYLHVVSGRLLLLPIAFITLTATYLFLYRFDYLPKPKTEKIKYEVNKDKSLKISEFPIFQNTALSQVKKIEFPFIEDDPEENFIIKLKDRNITVNQINGTVIEEQALAKTEIWEDMNLKLHTGRGNFTLALVLGITSFSILAFIYTGFAITFKRTRNKIKNNGNANDAEIVLLIGSENGSTLGFANHICKQLTSINKKVFVAELNKYQEFPKADHLIIMTSTYGLGDAPSNADHFLNLLDKVHQNKKIQVSIVGFGSKSYDDYCAYAEKIQEKISGKDWAEIITSMHKVNDKSTVEFTEWVKNWASQTLIPLATTPALYQQKVEHLKEFVVTGRSEIVDEATTFKVYLKPKAKLKFQSGDLLAIYPKNDHTERFYSVGKVEETVQLVVKLHENGLGSGFLHRLKEGDEIKARLMENVEFHFPKKAKKVIMIANGTGIAPFLGMIEENMNKIESHLYCGFRHDNQLTKSYQNFSEKQIEQGKLASFQMAFSKGEQQHYVMDLVRKDTETFIDLIKNKEYIMICGALKMQQDIEKLLKELSLENGLSFDEYKNQGYLLTDCY